MYDTLLSSAELGFVKGLIPSFYLGKLDQIPFTRNY